MTNYKLQKSSFVIRHSSFRAGFTLLETMVALAVLLAALVGPVSLITRGIFAFSFAKNKTVAANLTQEGIELMRAVRDNNIICNVLNGPAPWEWNRDPEGGLLTNTTREVSANSTVTVTCDDASGTVSISTPRLSLFTGQKIKFDSSTGLYGYSGTDTIFTRRVEIKSPPDSPDAGIPAGEQMDVISTVEWNERGIARSVILRERLFNWR